MNSNTTNIRNSYHDIDDNQGAIVIFTKKSTIDWNKKIKGKIMTMVLNILFI